MKMRGVAVLWGVLAVAAATGLFLLKYEVIALEDDLAALERGIARDRRAIHVLRAEWSYMNEPGRLNRLAARHLGLVPVTPDRMAALEALPFRPPADGAEPVARPLVLPPRVLNPGRADAIPVPGRKPAFVADVRTDS
ncbi:cell division protein FtsL [Roseospira goensis]|uniref:Cell division protein FtsL n=1 Tax=Roseospira goensis TaxID=391922 RepID=A0A7W6S1W4_9PROT|nr:hypothetical protein [Roseospira goensis]MBB4286644.1 hypothetical protein [Roseospira goensis]